LAQYLASLERIEKYSVQLVLPGHWDVFTDFHKRIMASRTYRQMRHEEVLAAVTAYQFSTAYQIASHISWNEKKNAWAFFQTAKKWGAVGDTLAELCYLREQGEVDMTFRQGDVLWSRKML
jgi:hypothetical protein